MDLLGIATEIENKLKEKKLVDRRLGSGFCFIDNSRDVQLEYPKAVRDYFSQLDTLKWVLSKQQPKKYGDKLEVDGKNIAPTTIIIKRADE